jgi:5'/3'-nucleotidase
VARPATLISGWRSYSTWQTGNLGGTNRAMTRPLILLTNDDGIRSPGLAAAAEAAHDLGELLIIAPATQQTGMGRASPAISGGAINEETVHGDSCELPAYAIAGSPAQAVIYGVMVLAPRRPDLVISGINYGENLGTCVTASGTVGAALQAAEMGIPGLALSLETTKAHHYEYGTEMDWRAANHFTRYFAQILLRQQLPFDTDVLKVDIPGDATPETPWRITRLARQSYFRIYRAMDQPENEALVRLDYEFHIRWDILEKESDIYAFAADRIVSVTPLSLDLTSRTDLAQLGHLLRGAAEQQR